MKKSRWNNWATEWYLESNLHNCKLMHIGGNTLYCDKAWFVGCLGESL